MTPIVFIHSNNCDYLPLSLWKARQSNPRQRVILIGDENNRHFSLLVEHFHQKDFSRQSDAFSKLFVNFSTNSHDFELVCLQRWFILKEFMEAQGLDECLYMDSDVLLFADVNESKPRFRTQGMSICGISGHTNFVRKRSTLSAFCDFIHQAYAKPGGLAELEEKYRIFRQTHEAGGISDMTFFVEFQQAHPEQILDLSAPHEGQMYDIAMAHFPDIENDRGIKTIRFENGKPYCRHKSLGPIEMKTLHFQGAAKFAMKEHLVPGSWVLDLLYTANKLYWLGQKAWRRLRRGAQG